MNDEIKWQPVVVVTNRRLECKCGTLAIIITGKSVGDPDHYNSLEDVDVWCQSCFTNAQEELLDI